MRRIMGTWHEVVGSFFIISHWVLHWIRNVSDKCCRENKNTLYVQ